MENSLQQCEKVQINIRENNERERVYLTSENSPALKAAMDKISAELLERNKNLYRRLVNAC